LVGFALARCVYPGGGPLEPPGAGLRPATVAVPAHRLTLGRRGSPCLSSGDCPPLVGAVPRERSGVWFFRFLTRGSVVAGIGWPSGVEPVGFWAPYACHRDLLPEDEGAPGHLHPAVDEGMDKTRLTGDVGGGRR
jgi:hypothetical protein